jgi:hypothetical protein
MNMLNLNVALKTAAGLVAVGILAAVVSAAPGADQQQTPAGKKETLSVPRLSIQPRIDGVLDPVWEAEALRLDNFVQLAPKANGTPTQKTTAYLGFDEKNFYAAFRCEDTEAGRLRSSVTNRDQCVDDDWIIVFLDTFNEKRRAFSFAANPIGVQWDSIRMEGGGNDNMDSSWDTAWESNGKIDPGGYIVEMAIPFKSLRFPDREDKVWGLTIARNIPRSGEIIIWPSFSRDIPGLLMQSGQIIIRGRVEKGGNLEIMPIATALQREGEKLDVQPGINLKYGVSSDLTLDATLNPDFSHIEADAPQIDVNLRFALRYPEKRPFFLEGMEIFQFPQIEMVYTRRIIDPFLGAKISGKLGRFTYGILSAYDTNPSESLWDVHGGSANTEDNALFNIIRVKADVFKDSYVGFCLADKEIDGSWNRVAGVDGQWRFANKFFFNFQAVASKTSYGGDPTDIAPAVYTEAFYFTKNWTAGGFWMSIHPDFEASSGFVNRTDYRSAGGFTSVTLYPDKPFLNQVRFSFQAGQRNAYFEDVVQDTWLRFQTQFRFTEFNQVFVEYEQGLERYADLDFRRGGLSIQGQGNIIRWLPLNLFFQIGDTINYDPDAAFLGWGATYGIAANIKPSNRLQVGLDYSKSTFWRSRGGERLWDYNVVRVRTTYQLTKTLSVRAIADYNHFDKQVFGSFLLSYVLRPGTVFFAGLDSNYDRNLFGRYDRRNYNIFVKFSYWWRM